MNIEITGLCRDHSFETAEDLCRRCGLEYCELCLVYPFGAGKPLCKECAMAEGGVRSHVQRAAMPKRDVRRRRKEFEARNGAGQGVSGNGNRETVPDPVLKDPLVPTDDDLDRVPAAVSESALVAQDFVDAFDTEPTPPSTPAVDDPANGVAPPIDWNQPFG